MPTVKRAERYVAVAYELCCGYKRAEALIQDMLKHLKDERGVQSAKDDTRGWDGDRMAVAVVYYNTLADANRLDGRVRALLSRNVRYGYEAQVHTCYGGRGPESYVTARTSLEVR